MKKKRPTIGLALGSGSAKGLAHVGILKVLHQNRIYPDYIAGTSVGALVGALYCAGHTPDEIEEIVKSTNWKNVVDFTIPKSGLIKGKLMEAKIRKWLFAKDFKDLYIPLNVVAYNITKQEKVVFSRGNVASAVRASISIPGIFAPFTMDKNQYIDGSICNPTPFSVVKEMGADIVIAVDLYANERKSGKEKKQSKFMKDLRTKFIVDELLNVKNYLFPERWPAFFREFMSWLFDKLLYPAKVLRILTKRDVPPITKVLYESINVLARNLARERLVHSKIDIKLTPPFKKHDWVDFEHVAQFIRKGEKEMNSELPKLLKLLKGRA